MKSQLLYIMSNWSLIVFSLIENVMNSFTIFFFLWLNDSVSVLGPRRSSLSQWWWLSFFVTLHCSLTQSVLLCVPRRSSSPSSVDWHNRCFPVEVRILFFIAFGLAVRMVALLDFYDNSKDGLTWHSPLSLNQRHGRPQNNRRRTIKMEKDIREE